MFVSLLYIAKNVLNVCDLDKKKKTVICLHFKLLERPPFSYMNGDPHPLFISLFRRSYAYTLHILVTPKSLAQK